jgi:hypothetical protein
LAIGCPIGITPARSGGTANMVASAITSVDPYRFSNTDPGSTRPNSPARPAVSSSPDTDHTRTPVRPDPPDVSSTAASREGTMTTRDMSRPAISRVSVPGSRSSSSRASSTGTPASSGPNSSQTESPNPNEDVWQNTSPGANGNSRHIHSSRFTIAPCVTTTPLGTPDDPDVYSTYAGEPATAGPAAPAGPSLVSRFFADSAGVPSGSTASPASSAMITAGAASPRTNPIRSAG